MPPLTPSAAYLCAPHTWRRLSVEKLAVARRLHDQSAVRLPVALGRAQCGGAEQIRDLVLSQLEAKRMARLDPEQDILVTVARLDSQGRQRIKRWQYPPASATCPSVLTSAELLARAGHYRDSTALVAVEVCLNHEQLLGLPVVSDLLPDPIPLHIYMVMPRTQP